MSPLETSLGATNDTPQAAFASRHIGLNGHDVDTMLSTIGVDSVDALLGDVIPPSILRKDVMQIGDPLSEAEILEEMR